MQFLKRFVVFGALVLAGFFVTSSTASAQTFALDASSASLTAIPATAGELLTPAGTIPPSAPPPPVIGLTLADLGLLPGDVIDAFSYGNDAPFGGTLFFSVSRTSVGLPGPPGDVTFEQTIHASPEAAGDVFTAGGLDPACPLPPGLNSQVLDGDGLAVAAFCYPGFGLGLAETVAPASVDNINEFETGYPGVGAITGIGFSLAAGSPTLAGANPLLPGGAVPGDVLVTIPGTGSPLFVFAPAASLGLVAGLPGCAPPACDDVDALSVSFPAGGTIAFSLAPGSPSLGLCGYSAADVLGAVVPPIAACAPAAMPAGILGLALGDDLDAIEMISNSCPIAPAVADLPDGDGFGACDNCPALFNPGQEDSDSDAAGDACDPCTDLDADGFGNPGFPNLCPVDLCPFIAGPNGDGDADGIGDVCDNCPAVANADQSDVDFDGVGDVCDACPHVTLGIPAPFDAGTLKKAQLGFKGAIGGGDDSVKAGATFTTATAFDPDSTDSVYVTITNTTTSAVLSSTSMTAGALWVQSNPAKLAWKYQTTSAPFVKASIKEAPSGSTIYKWKLGVKETSLPGPQIAPATDDMRVTMEILPANLCFSDTLATCTSSAGKKDGCKP